MVGHEPSSYLRAEYRFAQRTGYRFTGPTYLMRRAGGLADARPPIGLTRTLLYDEVRSPAKEMAVAAAGILERANFV